MKPYLAILVLNWRQPQITIKTVDSFLSANTKKYNFHLYLTDSHSPDDSLFFFKRKYGADPRVTIFQTKSNLGYSGGHNYVLRQIKNNFDYYLIANNDLKIDKNAIDFLIARIHRSPKLGIVGPKVYFYPQHEYHFRRYQDSDRGRVIWSVGGLIDWNNLLATNIGLDQVDRGQFNQPAYRLGFIPGCFLLIRHSVLEKIGYFDEDYFLYFEDVDYCHRARLAGFNLAVVPQSIVWHINAASSAVGGNLADYFLTRNRLIFARKFAPLKTNLLLLKQSIFTFFGHSPLWQKRAIIDFYLNRLKQGSWT
jgi:GT2 family glycosyltransferase